MIAFGSDTRVFVATEPVDFRRGVHGLVALVAEGLAGNPYSGDVFVFRSKRADKLRFLIFDGSGMILATKWLEEGRFTWPPIQAGTMRLTATQFAMLFEGLSEWHRVEPRAVKRPTNVA
ncbi:MULTISPECIES: IS66 family insertion sequence element accessory protein TnpB [unclassified Mesorhizobium]|uniref:IS66 family insertion sequence element accessory protein TnpB n=1 Tax=unclassified Mesorhizobium TaxID=325217 RepID=UPI000F755246|nr:MULTISPECIES: IS66 family insertion sequence element accessory protein TnpB [unclassified Mesorhizobium]AZO07918.1 transposase [Mesorhizobium sp. M3A.F.Ca.ET.080.04.2.1]AZO09548.1 transposase [Mesorhizobium sp. M3A.F.Ca.ET.080.04.2.1]RWB68894.1 MAG: transposase [Mesorhizobium sp.]RWD60531.1 MAG: transposase [Mesorhizobium sp.]RWF14227.1 MAG: transposase [Mesorhizobium sp.]